MGETIVLVVLLIVLLKKFNSLSVLHVEWGLFRLEFGSTPRKAKGGIKPSKHPKQVRN